MIMNGTIFDLEENLFLLKQDMDEAVKNEDFDAIECFDEKLCCIENKIKTNRNVADLNYTQITEYVTLTICKNKDSEKIYSLINRHDLAVVYEIECKEIVRHINSVCGIAKVIGLFRIARHNDLYVTLKDILMIDRTEKTKEDYSAIETLIGIIEYLSNTDI